MRPRPTLRAAAALVAVLAPAAGAADAGARTLAHLSRPITSMSVDGHRAYVSDGRSLRAYSTATGHAAMVCKGCGTTTVIARDGAYAIEESYPLDPEGNDGTLLGRLPGHPRVSLATSGQASDSPYFSAFTDVVVGGGRIAWRDFGVTSCDPTNPDDPACNPDIYDGIFPYEEYSDPRIAGPAASLPTSALAIAKDGRVLLDDGRLLDPGLHLLRKLRLPKDPGATYLDGGTVVLRTATGVTVLDATSGATIGARTLAKSARVLDARGGLVLIAGPRRLLVWRPADGHLAVVARAATGARIAGGGIASEGAVFGIDRGSRAGIGVVSSQVLATRLG